MVLRAVIAVQVLVLMGRDEMVSRRADQRGQGSLEYVAMLGLAAAIVAAIFAFDLVNKVKGMASGIEAFFTSNN